MGNLPAVQKILNLVEDQGKSPRDVFYDDWGEVMSPLDDEAKYDYDGEQTLFSDDSGYYHAELRDVSNGHLLGGRIIA